jgi:hypothetical protein
VCLCFFLAHLEHLAVGLHASIHVARAYRGVPEFARHGCMHKMSLHSSASDLVPVPGGFSGTQK